MFNDNDPGTSLRVKCVELAIENAGRGLAPADRIVADAEKIFEWIVRKGDHSPVKGGK